MSKVDSKDSSRSTDAMAATMDSGSRPVPGSKARDVADAGADTMDSGSRPVPGSKARDVADSGADTVLGGDSELGNEALPPLAEADELIGALLNERYEVTAKIGQGGMGAVYEAKHTLIGKRVAVKVLLDKHAAKDQIVARLEQEARLASSIGHDNIVNITDFGKTDSGRTFVVMEYLDGESLGEAISRQGKIEETRTIHICAQIASALAAAHDKGIVHRDIKPDNIFLVKRGDVDFVKVVDFGISKSMDTDNEDVRLTQTGMVLGTPLYMSPEQARGDDDLDHRIDIYALGVILYEATTGEVPFQGKNYLNILTQVISDEPRNPSEIYPDIDRDLESVIMKAMAKDRDQRYQKMSEIAADLDALTDPNTASTGARITAARWRQRRERRTKRSYAAWLLAVVGVGAVSIVAAGFLSGSDVKRKAAPVAEPAGLAVRAPVTTPPPPPPTLVETEATIPITSVPAGAMVFNKDQVICGPTPVVCKLPIVEGQVFLRIVLEGYEEGTLLVDPEAANHNEEPLVTTLIPIPKDEKKGPKKGPKNNHKEHKTGPKEGTTTSDTGSNSTGDTIGNPYKTKKAK
jgi:serine/threonine-protein kinase